MGGMILQAVTKNKYKHDFLRYVVHLKTTTIDIKLIHLSIFSKLYSI